MFKKPFKVKTSVPMKSTDAKKFREKLKTIFPSLKNDKILDLIFPNKSTIKVKKLLLHNNSCVIVYYSNNHPIVLEVEEKYYPTVQLLQSFPRLVHVFTIYSEVQEIIKRGVDLMIPGLKLPDSDNITIKSYGNLKKGDTVAITPEGSDYPIAVGKAFHSSYDIYMCGGKGKCVELIQTLGDSLWNSGPCLDIPKEVISNIELSLIHISDNSNSCENVENNENIIDEISNEASSNISIVDDDIQSTSETINYDEILYNSFLKSLVSSMRNTKLPIHASLLYRGHILEALPPNVTLDIKSTKYKKLSNFLNEMCQKGVIKMNSVQAGVDSVISINYNNEDLKDFLQKFPEYKLKQNQVTTQQPDNNMLLITQRVLPLYSMFDFKLGDKILKNDARKLLTDYIQENNLQDPVDKRYIVLDTILYEVFKMGKLSWNVLFNNLFQMMSSNKRQKEIKQTNNQSMQIKSNVPNIHFVKTVKKGKKITLIYNLQFHIIDLQDFCNKCKVFVAGSVSVKYNENEPTKIDYIQVQGHQIPRIITLLTDVFQISKSKIQAS